METYTFTITRPYGSQITVDVRTNNVKRALEILAARWAEIQYELYKD